MGNTIYCVMGKSGAGKDTVVNDLCAKTGLRRLNSYTTRPSRGPGDLHEFVESYEVWLANNADDPVVAYTFFNGNHYWASQSQVEHADLYVIDPDGVEWFRTRYQGTKKIRAIYIDVPWHKRFVRMLRRGDGVQQAWRRIVHDHNKFKGATKQADYIVRNDDAVQCMWELALITKGELG